MIDDSANMRAYRTADKSLCNRRIHNVRIAPNRKRRQIFKLIIIRLKECHGLDWNSPWHSHIIIILTLYHAFI